MLIRLAFLVPLVFVSVWPVVLSEKEIDLLLEAPGTDSALDVVRVVTVHCLSYFP